MGLRNKILTAVFIVFEITWFVLYVCCGLFSDDVAYIAVVAAFLFSLVFVRENWLLPAGLFFTCVADIFLVLLNGDGVSKYFGLLFFILAQGAYMFLIYFPDLKISRPDFTVRVAMLGAVFVAYPIVVFATPIMEHMNPLLPFMAAVYAVMSVCNIVFSFIKIKANPLLPFALSLLLLCDIFVMTGFFGVSFGFNFMWLFYMPSQALFALSALNRRS